MADQSGAESVRPRPCGSLKVLGLTAAALEPRLAPRAFDQNSPQKYVVCNADEGDSGTFSDRMIMEGDPFVLIEGMTIAGIAVGASEGYIYLRSEYPHALRTLTQAIEAATRAGYLGADIAGSGRPFRLEIRLGAGAYICGEETAMLESLEGKRGVIRFKPPLPAIAGLFGQPTVVNNVITLSSIPAIIADGGKAYNEYGVGRSRGTIPLQLAGNIKRPGLFELPFGLTLREGPQALLKLRESGFGAPDHPLAVQAPQWNRQAQHGTGRQCQQQHRARAADAAGGEGITVGEDHQQRCQAQGNATENGGAAREGA